MWFKFYHTMEGGGGVLGMLFMATVTRGQMSWMPVRWGKCYNTQQCRTTEADDSKPQSGQESKLPATFLILNDTLKKTKNRFDRESYLFKNV